MAEGQEDRSRDDLTEEASPHRIEEYRRKGMVAQSREVAGLAVLLAAGVTAYVMSPKMGAQLLDFMREVFRTDLSARMDLGSLDVSKTLFFKALGLTALISLPICFAGFIMGVFGSFVQIGTVFSTDPITPDFEKVDPIAGFKRLFSMKALLDGVRLLLKLVAVSAVSYWIVKSEILQSPTEVGEGATGILASFGHAGRVVFPSLILVLGVFAAMDWALQHWEMSKQLRMTKQEAKQEHKEREGDPQIKARIRAVQRDLARKRMMEAVKKADVIVTNPTHIAIALQYDKDSMAAPKVVAKGADFIAQRIKKIAADAGVPMVENVPLARTLYKTVKLNQAVPRALYQAVAEILAYVYRLKHRRF